MTPVSKDPQCSSAWRRGAARSACALLVAAACAPSRGDAQSTDAPAPRRVTIRLTLPLNASAGAPPYYLAAEHNRWRAADSSYRFALVDGRYQLSFVYDRPYFLQYKITRGSNATDESNAEGYGVSPRLADVRVDTTIDVRVEAFRDAVVKRTTASPRTSVFVDSFQLPSLNRTRRISVYLPTSYRTSTRRYPVLYLMDGEALFDRARTDDGDEWRVDETLDSLARRGVSERIVVAIDDGGFRGTEYLPYATASGRPRAEGDAFMRDLVTALKPAIDRRYRTKRGAVNTAIGGSSMGAVIALYGLLHYPTTFGSAAVFSLPRWPGFPLDSLMADVVARRAALNARLFLYVGTREGSEESVTTMRALYVALRVNPRLDVTLEIKPEGDHTASSWRAPFARFASWLTP